MCLKYTQEYLYTSRVKVGSRHQQMPFALKRILGEDRVLKQTLQLHLILAKWWVLDINLPLLTKIISIPEI